MNGGKHPMNFTVYCCKAYGRRVLLKGVLVCGGCDLGALGQHVGQHEGGDVVPAGVHTLTIAPIKTDGEGEPA